jgi:hypothetical protein
MNSRNADKELQLKCPYCGEEIIEGGRTCRYCRSDLTFLEPIGTVSVQVFELEDKISDVTDFLDSVRPVDQRVNQQIDSEADLQPDKVIPLIGTAAKYVVGNLTAGQPQWRRMATAVALTAVTVVVSSQLGNLLQAASYVFPTLSDFLVGVVYVLTTIPGLILTPGVTTLAPILFGF